MNTIERMTIETCIGSCTLYTYDHQAVYFDCNSEDHKATEFLHKNFKEYTVQSDQSKLILGYANQIKQYFEGRLKKFEIPYLLFTTPFRKQVLNAVATIPYGTVLSYKDIGNLIGSAGYRAIGGTVKVNPLPVIIPCHRVVGSNGIGGFSMGDGLKTKRTLLLIEKNHA